jgi:hypothetical protein
MMVLQVLLAGLSRLAVLQHERAGFVLPANSNVKHRINPDDRVILF